MALSKLITLPSGKMLNYHYIMHVKIFNGTCDVILGSFVDERQRARSIEPEFKERYRIPYTKVGPFLNTEGFDVRSAAYTHIKSLDSWKGCKDVLDEPLDLESIPGTPGPQD